MLHGLFAFNQMSVSKSLLTLVSMSLIIHKLNAEALLCVLLDLMSLSTIFQSSQVFGCEWELNTQFNSTSSRWYQVPDT